MAVLAGHRAERAHLPKEPLRYVGTGARFRRQKLAGLLGEILEDGAGFENLQRPFAVDRRYRTRRRDAIVGPIFSETQV